MSETLFYDLQPASGLTNSLSDELAREIGRQIVAAHYQPGELIEDEASLAQRHNVSRSVVRDAVKILVGKNLLEVRRGIGTRVRGRQSWGLLDNDVLAWHLSAPIRPAFLRQLMDVRAVIEPEACRWAAEHGTEEAIADILDAQSAMEMRPRSLKKFVVSDALFHRAILRATGNEIVQAMEGIIISALLISIRLTNADTTQNSDTVILHRSVADAIAGRECERAASFMKRLLDDAQARLDRVLGNA